MTMAKTPNQVSLGVLMGLLAAIDGNLALRIEGRDEVPALKSGSYRGYYEDLAISFLDEGTSVSVKEVLNMLRGAMGYRKLHGYKGGVYDCTESTSVWLGNYGSSQGAAITGVKVEDGVALLTWEEDEYTGWPKKGGGA
jgi:hypothetical protein